MELMQKLEILTDSAKYDAACTSSGVDRPGGKGLGNAVAAGCCHSFSADGRCISLLKVLFTNHCIYDCKYCVNRASNDTPRAAFTPEELAELTIQFYRRNYIEGLFLSSGVVKSPDYTMELMIRALELLRQRHAFNGYIHCKIIPGASEALVERLGLIADRMSVNIELPSAGSLARLAPHKTKNAILNPMRQIAGSLAQNGQEIAVYRHAPRFAPAGQATQMIIGASPESDYQILSLASGLYARYALKRVFYSAYIPVVEDGLLPALYTPPPLLREHRLYQADFLMRQYAFAADEILSEREPNFNPYLDPKCDWAIRNMHFFPVDVNRASKEALLRVPGIGPVSARRIVTARRSAHLRLDDLKRLGVVMKRARYFILAGNSAAPGLDREAVLRALIDPAVFSHGMEQLRLFSHEALPPAAGMRSLEEAVGEAVKCMAGDMAV